MYPVRRVDFVDALPRLQAMIGQPVEVYLNLPGYFFDCGFVGRLQRVITLAEPDGPLLIAFEAGQSIVIDPAEIAAFVHEAAAPVGQHCLEFDIADRAQLLIIGPAHVEAS